MSDDRLTPVEIAARGMCRSGRKTCVCDDGEECFADELFGTYAAQAVGALRGAGFIKSAAQMAMRKNRKARA